MKTRFRFDDGSELTVPDGVTAEEFFARHTTYALSEGLCPVHPTVRLAVVDQESAFSAPTGRPWLHHKDCDFWRFDPVSGWVDFEVRFAFWGIDPYRHTYLGDA